MTRHAELPSDQDETGPVAGVPLAASRPALAAQRSTPATLGGAVRDAIALRRSGDRRLLGAPAWWGFDAAVLWAMLNAFGAPPAIAVIVLAPRCSRTARSRSRYPLRSALPHWAGCAGP
jgi:hypothetical protein